MDMFTYSVSCLLSVHLTAVKHCIELLSVDDDIKTHKVVFQHLMKAHIKLTTFVLLADESKPAKM